MKRFFAVTSALVLVVACGHKGGDNGGDDTDANNSGADADNANNNNNGDAGSAACGTILGTIRDFVGVETPGYNGSGAAPTVHPSFEHSPANSGAVKGLVETALGSDHKPVLNTASANLTTAFLNYGSDGVTAGGGPAAGTNTRSGWFAKWYTDTAGLSQTIQQEFPLVEDPVGSGIYAYDTTAYFPIDNAGWGIEYSPNTATPEKGDDTQPHNFHFTTEFHASFTYNGGEKFTFRGDDDVWVFVNNTLAIDIGGIHGPVSQRVDFDADTEQDLDTNGNPVGAPTTLNLGLTVGVTYNIDFFQAERHVTGSNFRLQTSIACFNNVIF